MPNDPTSNRPLAERVAEKRKEIMASSEAFLTNWGQRKESSNRPPMTDARLAEIATRVVTATEGPISMYRIPGSIELGNYIVLLPPDGPSVAYCMDQFDAQFFAHARADIPDLLAEVQRLREALRMATGTLTLIQKDAPKDRPVVTSTFTSGMKHSHWISATYARTTLGVLGIEVPSE